MTELEVLKTICSEKIKLSNIKYKNDFMAWFWLVGFNSFEINEENKTISCFVERPNKFIGRWNKKYCNFLVHLKRYYQKEGYNFEIYKCDKKYLDNMYDIANDFNLS